MAHLKQCMSQTNNTTFIEKRTSIEVTINLFHRFRIWKQKCEQQFIDPLELKPEGKKCKYSFILVKQARSGTNSQSLTEEEQNIQKKYWRPIGSIC